ncbi:putative ML domain [Monocercomonoides exilis]|uniref:putative ML domain n=1 Tax=Monocercomonoides exilis TaxID=2049356 RepID=UPI00355A4582|nr:putative ML domain [Monocercomonoides exilis]|eukprot:MONOS_285.1-p1 / transcript=MONOS_285.1 / gene=MONOS_285 / organism=Monocercomonoides_exilis_PA203 / gene_product=unspecified product / transcript_product=unspecified product / location=Mono_scaffold00004:308548-308952(-) / protein_length=134 / sequence_SO=supercontig / SO=protein_coding / is_pseudo=false
MFGILLALFACTQSINVVDCLNGAGSMHLVSIKIDPEPPVHGQDCQASVEFAATKQLTTAQCQLIVKKVKIPIYRMNFDMCKALGCPLQPGNYGKNLTIPIPSYTPTGKYDLEIHCNNENKREIICAKAPVQIA